jgi:hypothetical protein
MARFRVTPLYAAPFEVEAEDEASARLLGHARLRQLRHPQSDRIGTVIYKVDLLNEAAPSR